MQKWILMTITGLMLFMGCRGCFAATDDVAFDECMKLLDRSKYVLPGQVWVTKPLPRAVEEVVHPTLAGAKIVRWMVQANRDGSRSYLVLTREIASADEEDDADLLYVLMENHKHINITSELAVNAAVFAKTLSHGVYGIYSCWQGELRARPDVWNGHDWD